MLPRDQLHPNYQAKKLSFFSGLSCLCFCSCMKELMPLCSLLLLVLLLLLLYGFSFLSLSSFTPLLPPPITPKSCCHHVACCCWSCSFFCLEFSFCHCHCSPHLHPPPIMPKRCCHQVACCCWSCSFFLCWNFLSFIVIFHPPDFHHQIQQRVVAMVWLVVPRHVLFYSSLVSLFVVVQCVVVQT